MDSNNIIEKIKKILMEELEINAIILFGSYARGTQKLTSNIDVAIKIEKQIEKKQLLTIRDKIEQAIDIDVHLIDLASTNEDFRYEILLSGKTIYCKDEYELEMYKLRQYSDYLLFSEDRKIIIDKVKEGGTLYGK